MTIAERWSRKDWGRLVEPWGNFRLFPSGDQRDGWLAVSDETKQTWVTLAERFVDYEWPTMSADLYLRYKREGDNLKYLNRFYERRSALGILTVAECLEWKGRFIDPIVSGVIAICEETTWITPHDLMHRKLFIPSPEDVDVDLSSGETGAVLAWVHYLMGSRLDVIHPRIRERIETEVRRRLIEPYLRRDDFWWMGFVPSTYVNNWNPWCNQNVLISVLLLERDQADRAAVVGKAARSLEAFIRKYSPDGCCEEGPMYWGASGGGLHTCLKLLSECSGGDDIGLFKEEIVGDIGRYIYRAHIHGDYFVNFADGDARFPISSNVFAFGTSIGDDRMIQLGASAERRRPVVFSWFNMHDYLQDIFLERKLGQGDVTAPYVREAWMDAAQVLTARETEGSEIGLFLAAKGGHNHEPHNHNDVGNFIVYADGCPVFIDLGTEDYTAATFGPDRYTLWYTQSQYHNCPTVRGVLQQNGQQYRSRDAECFLSDDVAELSMDLEAAYPSEAGIASWKRIVRLSRGTKAAVEISDSFALNEATDEIALNLMTPLAPVNVRAGVFELEYAPNRRVEIVYDAEILTLTVEPMTMMGNRIRRNWGDAMYRLVLKASANVNEGTYIVKVKRLEGGRGKDDGA
ncbi:heparinase II/III domain-containing protein [Cohnella herbarum]|uniref:Heparinase II/III-like C-terminal domain-containing protein n=1 Tax=Cohnella herbarum TaxID=2728023 RepID=A0A7Z2VRJ6_9BACL|nr:heparinase II/III family protein [Cohnella herbarum]QJD87835.1 hypothetical protein HH215_34675 [Cohnella herbarum]